MFFAASFEQGRIAENFFESVAKNRKWGVTKSSSVQNRLEHWDFLLEQTAECKDNMLSNIIISQDGISSESKSIKVDVKSMKKINRTDEFCQQRLVWIEMSGNGTNKGWLYGSLADIIAFETINTFVLVSRLKLIEFVDKNVNKEMFVKTPSNALYCMYNRKGVWNNYFGRIR